MIGLWLTINPLSVHFAVRAQLSVSMDSAVSIVCQAPSVIQREVRQNRATPVMQGRTIRLSGRHFALPAKQELTIRLLAVRRIHLAYHVRRGRTILPQAVRRIHLVLRVKLGRSIRT